MPSASAVSVCVLSLVVSVTTTPAAVLATTFVLLMLTGSTVSVGLDGSVTCQLPVLLTAEEASVT